MDTSSMTFQEIEEQIQSLFDSIKLLPDPLDQAAARALVAGYLLATEDKRKRRQ